MSGLSWRQTGAHSGVIESGSHPLAEYRFGSEANHPHFRELRPLGHRGVLTTTAPWDHRWHHGLWWSWKFIDDVLYWEDHPAYGNGTGALGRAWVVGHEVADRGDAVVIDERIEWRPDDGSGVDLHERRTLTVRAVDAETWSIDWDHRWTPERDVRLSATSYPEHSWGGYGGLNYRPARAMAAGETMLAAGGRSSRDALHGEHAAWMAYGGRVDGSGADEPDRPATGGVAILQHPDNDAFPAPVYAFSADDGFGFLAAAPLMHGPRVLPKGEELRLRFRTLVLGDLPDADALELSARRYPSAASPTP